MPPRPPAPDLIILGQVTIDDVVPASPGAWTRQIGGSALYALAGARLWIDPASVGLVVRTGTDYPFDVEALLRDAGVQHVERSVFAAPHLVEWLIYEPDGTRRSLPRNPELLQLGAEGALSQHGRCCNTSCWRWPQAPRRFRRSGCRQRRCIYVRRSVTDIATACARCTTR